jgi:hypothetical protein
LSFYLFCIFQGIIYSAWGNWFIFTSQFFGVGDLIESALDFMKESIAYDMFLKLSILSLNSLMTCPCGMTRLKTHKLLAGSSDSVRFQSIPQGHLISEFFRPKMKRLRNIS